MNLDNQTLRKYKYLIAGFMLLLFCLLIFFTSVKWQIKQAIEEATGRTAQINNLEISWSMDPSFSMDSITLSGVATDDSVGEFLRADGVKGDLSLLTLFDDRIVFHQLDLAKLVLDSHFSFASNTSDTESDIPFLSTALPLLGDVNIQSFNVQSRDTDGGISEQLINHEVLIKATKAMGGVTHDFSSSGYWGRSKLQLLGPITIDRFSVSASDLLVTLNEQPLKAEMDATFSYVTPLVEVLLSGISFDIKNSVAVMNAADEVAVTAKNSRMFSDAVLPLLWLRDVDILFQAKVDRVVLGNSIFRNYVQHGTLKSGLLKSKLTATGLHGGTLIVESDLDFRSGLRAHVNASGTLREYPLHRLPSAYSVGLKEGGELDARFEISAIGRSMAEVAANSEGELQAIVRDGTMRDRWIDNIGGDVARALKFWIAGEGKTKNVLNCLAANLKIEQGAIDVNNNIIFNTPSVTVVAAGELDLASEEVRLRVVPMARNGTGLNVGSYINVVQIGGTLSKMRPTINAVGTLKAGGSVWLATATGGISLLAEGYLKRKFRKEINCDDVMPQSIFPALD